MAIFKVSRHDKPSVKKLIKAETITELITAAKTKLSLTDNQYKIYMEDFTEIDDSEILQELASTSKEQLVLILVPDGIDWDGEMSSKNEQEVSKDQPETITEPRPSSSRQASDLDNIYCKLSSSVQKSLRIGKFLDCSEKRTLIHVVANYMMNDLKDTTLTTAKKMGHRVVNNYSSSFTVRIEGFTLEAASASLGQKIYDRINYVKQDHHDSKASQSYTLEDLEEPTNKKPKTQDEYGCVAYLPELPENETWESQEEKRLVLIDNYESSKPVEEVIQQMAESYWLKRKHIHKEQDLAKFFVNWPYFTHFKIIIAHADHLLGINCLETWKNSLNDLYVPIILFSRTKEILAVEKFKKKNKGQDIPRKLRHIFNEQKKAKEYSIALNNKRPYKNILFDFINQYMGSKEKLGFLYVLISEDTEDDKLLDTVNVPNPVLIIRGNDIHNDPSNKYDIVIEKRIIIEVNTFLDGILITFLLYFIFGFVYPPEIEGTLEIIQRLFFKINPPRGTKRGGKRKAVIQHPKYTSFVQEIDTFKDHESNDL